MKKDYAKLIYKLNEYDLFKNFKDIDKLSGWLYQLNDEEASRFLSLSLPSNNIVFPKKLLIDKNLLQCEDYLKRVNMMNQLPIKKDSWHLLDKLCSPNFLHSKNYYSDMTLLKSSKNIQYALWVIDDDNFLESPYHEEDMKILSENASISHYLYPIMTKKEYIQGKYYREEIEALTKANSKLKARAIYYYITNPSLSKEERYETDDELWDSQVPFRALWFLKRKNDTSEKGSKNPKYLENLTLLNSIEDKYVIFIEKLLSDSLLRKQNYQEKDIQTLLSLNNDELFFDLFEVMSNKNSATSIYHLVDISLIQNTSSYFARRMLISIATNKENLNSKNHWLDMNYVASLDFDSLDSKTQDLLQYLFLTQEGIKDKKRDTKLKQIHPEFSLEKIDKRGLKLSKKKGLSRIKKYFS